MHLSSRCHRALCYRAADLLGVPGAADIGALDSLMHDSGPPEFEPWSSTWVWAWYHAAPWLARRLRGRRAGDGLSPKHREPLRIAPWAGQSATPLTGLESGASTGMEKEHQ